MMIVLKISNLFKVIGTLLMTAFLISCGGGGGSSASTDTSGSGLSSFTVGGTLSGLGASPVVLSLNQTNDLSLNSNGVFSFGSALNNSVTYAVTIKTQPSGYNCSVSNGTGVISGSNVSNIAVVCSPIATYTIGGSLTGLGSSTIVLQNNLGNDLTLSANGNFTFTSPLTSGSAYSVTIKTQAQDRQCIIGAGSGTVSSSNVSSVQITCTPISNNSLGLTPAPIFVASSKPVNYNDCFPVHTDILVGDIATDRIEKYTAGTGITSYDTINRVTAVAPYSFGSRTGLRITTNLDNPSVGIITGGQTVALEGAMFDVYSFNRNSLTNALINENSSSPTVLGDLSLGRINNNFQVGDSVNNQYVYTSQFYLSPQITTVQLNETLTFLGTELNTVTAAGTFAYTCVFRKTITTLSGAVNLGTQTYDVYYHKSSGAKVVEYNAAAPRPLIRQLVSNTAINRRGGL